MSTKVKYILAGKSTEVNYEKGDTLLDTALRNNINAPYSCMEGICATCLARIEEGAIDTREDTVLTQEEFSAGKVLTCQSKPKEGCSLVVVNYDKI